MTILKIRFEYMPKNRKDVSLIREIVESEDPEFTLLQLNVPKMTRFLNREDWKMLIDCLEDSSMNVEEFAVMLSLILRI